MLQKAPSHGSIWVFLPRVVLGGVILQYVDDTIIFLEKNLDYARNLELILAYFEALSGLNFLFHKMIFYE